MLSDAQKRRKNALNWWRNLDKNVRFNLLIKYDIETYHVFNEDIEYIHCMELLKLKNILKQTKNV